MIPLVPFCCCYRMINAEGNYSVGDEHGTVLLETGIMQKGKSFCLCFGSMQTKLYLKVLNGPRLIDIHLVGDFNNQKHKFNAKSNGVGIGYIQKIPEAPVLITTVRDGTTEGTNQ